MFGSWGEMKFSCCQDSEHTEVTWLVEAAMSMRSFLVACSLSFYKPVAKVSSADRLSISS